MNLLFLRFFNIFSRWRLRLTFLLLECKNILNTRSAKSSLMYFYFLSKPGRTAFVASPFCALSVLSAWPCFRRLAPAPSLLLPVRVSRELKSKRVSKEARSWSVQDVPFLEDRTPWNNSITTYTVLPNILKLRVTHVCREMLALKNINGCLS